MPPPLARLPQGTLPLVLAGGALVALGILLVVGYVLTQILDVPGWILAGMLLALLGVAVLASAAWRVMLHLGAGRG